jgi:hypothetical protein
MQETTTKPQTSRGLLAVGQMWPKLYNLGADPQKTLPMLLLRDVTEYVTLYPAACVRAIT